MTPRDALAAARCNAAALTGVLDQGVIGVGNLAVGLLVVHLSSKEGYGRYTLCYMAVVATSSLVTALFAGPMIVGYHERPDGERHRFAAGALRATVLAVASLGLAAMAAAALVSGEWRWLLILSALAAVGATTQDFLRSFLFVVRRGHAALLFDGLALLVWAGSTVALVRAGGVPADMAALAGCALASLAMALAAMIDTGLFPSPDPQASAATYWRRGRWNLGGAAITAAQNQGHVYLAGLIVSAAAVADLNAARMLMAPMGVLIIGSSRTLVPALSRLFAGGDPRGADRLAGRALALMLAIVLAYTAMLLLAPSTLIPAVLGPRYAGVTPLLMLWAAVTVLQAVDMNLSAVMQAAQRFRELAFINLWTSIPVLVCVVPMIRRFGVTGNLLVLGGGYLLMNLLLAWKLYGGDNSVRLAPGR